MADSVNVLLSFVNTELGGWPILQGPMWDDATFNFSQLLLKLAEYSSDVIYIAGTEIDEMNSSVQAIRIGQSDLGLLDRSYYVNESDVTKAYRQFIQNFALALATDRSMINNDVNDIFNFEKTIATFDFVRHLRRLYLLANVSLVDTDVVIASELDYLRNVSLIVDQQSPRVLQNYMVWRFMMSRAWIIPRRFRTIKQQFDQVFLGTTVEQVRAMKCARYVNYNMGFAVSKLYIDKYFDKDARIESIVMIDNIRNQFIDIINQSTWMNSISKSRAIDKARAINAKVGYPAYLDDNNNTKLEKNYAEYNFNSSFARNVLLMLKLNAKKNLQVLRQLLDREEWIGYTPTIVNAFYNPSFNDISFPAGILQTPFFYKDAPKYLNYGAIGTIIGHEITHGFDNFGGLYDKDGNKILWWDNETLSAFNQRKTCIIDQYNNYTVTQIDLPVNGEQTQGENIADNGGLKAAFAQKSSSINNHPFSLPKTNQSLDNKKPEIDQHNRRYSSIHVQRISRTSSNNSTTNLLPSYSNQSRYSRFDLQSMNSSSNNQEMSFWHPISSEQTNQLPSYVEKTTAMPCHMKRRSQSLNHEKNRFHTSARVQWISRLSSYRKKIIMPLRNPYKISPTPVREESFSPSSKVTRFSLE
ncbi:unnamed protein product [Rotaria socialis]|uniref:Uncharacterized protein n=1 Tax=Rotaria socialis TaxID=392032 RepID=A0A817QCC6_9BILA|nr:unnamed protein product [Rotaria socialis]